MEIKFVDLINAKRSLEKILTKDLPIKQAIVLSLFVKEANDHFEVYKEQSEKIWKKYGITHNNEKIMIEPEKTTEFQKEINGLNLQIIKLDYEKIMIDDYKDIKLTPVDILNLDKFIEFKG